MLKKVIPLFMIGLALAGCGTDNNGALEDNNQRLTPEVQEEMTEESHPGIPGVGDIDVNRNENNDAGDTNSKKSNNGVNNGVNGTGNNEAVSPENDETLETPDMDGNMYESGLDDNH